MTKTTLGLLCLLLVSLPALGAYTVGTYDEDLDPARITMWNSNWCSAAVELSKINAAATGVSVTVRWSPSTDLEDFTLELILPTGFTVSGDFEETYARSVSAGEDVEVTFDGTVTNPAAGAYGPVKLRARKNSGSQIIAINDNFAVLYISAAENTSTANLVVAFVDSTTRYVGQAGVDLKFTFTLSEGLWKHDLVVLHIDDNFSLSASVTCTSAAASDSKFYFPGTDDDNLSDVACEADDSNVLYIYGLGADVDIRDDKAKTVTIVIKSVTLPGSQISTFDFKLEIVSFGTNWVMQTGSTTTGLTFEPAVITSASWKSTWSYLTSSNILPEMVLYVDVMATIINAIPKGGKIIIDVSGSDDALLSSDYDGNSSTGCYIVSGIADATCDVDETNDDVEITLPSGLAAGYTIQVTVLVDLGSDTTLAFEITTFDENDLSIDKGTTASSTFTAVSSSVIKLSTFALTLGHSYTGPNDDTHSLEWECDGIAANDLLLGSTFNINLPISTASASDNQFYIESSNVPDLQDSGNNDILTATVTTYTISTGTRDTGYLSFTLPEASALTEVFVVIADTAEPYISNPLVASNAETRYQTFVTISANSNKYYGVTQIGIDAASWTIALESVNTANVAGAPVAVSITVGEFDFAVSASSDRTYYVDITFNSLDFSSDQLGSGASAGADYDCYIDSGSDTSSKCTVSGDTLTVTGLSLDASDNEEDVVYFTIGALSASPDITVTGYFVLTNDVKKTKHVLYEQTAADQWTLGTVANAEDAEVNSDSAITLNSSSELSVEIGFDLADATKESIAIIFQESDFALGSVGAKLGDTSDTNAPLAVAAANVFAFSTPNWSSVLILEAAIGTFVTANYDEVNLTGITSRGYVETTTTVVLLGENPLDSTDLDAGTSGLSPVDSTNYSSDASTTTVKGAISNLEVTPRTVIARNSSNATTDVTVKFKVTNAVPVDGKIELTYNSALWGYVDNTVNLDLVTIAGVSDEDASTKVTITHSAGVFTIQQFARIAAGTTITVVIPRLLAPINAQASPGVNFITDIETSTADDDLIDDVDVETSLNKVIVTAAASTTAGTSTSTLTTIPPNAGLASAVDLYVSFSFNRNIPQFGYFILTLSSSIDLQYDSGTLEDILYLRGIEYSSCEVSSNGIKVVLAEDYISGNTLELYLEEGVKNPSTVTAVATAWSFTASYGSLLIIDDVNRATAYSYTAPAAVAGTITAGTTGISVDIENAGEESTYTFNFKSSVVLAKGDQIWIVFPDNYDYFIGNAMELFASEEDTYYLACASEVVDLGVCKVDRRHVVVDVVNEILADTLISVALMVCNPDVLTTGQFKIYHGSSSGIVAANQSFGTVTLTGNVDNLVHISAASIDNHELFSLDSDIKLQFYILGDTLADTDAVMVNFPVQWDLSYATGDSVECTSTILDESSTALSTATDVTWVDSSSCSVMDQHIMLQLATGDGQAFSNYDDMITLTLKNIDNPEWSNDFEKHATWTFSITDEETYDAYEYWTDKFEVYVHDATNKEYTSRSYPETNAAYLGFDDKAHQLFVHGFRTFAETGDDFDESPSLSAYDPKTMMNRIIVFPGTQTEDLHVVTESSLLPLASKSLTLKCDILGYVEDGSRDDLTVSSVDNFTFKERDELITFRVSADINASLGLYYLDWSISEEVLQAGVSEAQYQPPVKTLVEIAEKTEDVYRFQLGDFPTFYSGETSLYIPVYLDHAPDTDVTLTVSVAVKATGDQSTLVDVEPNVLTFGPDVHVRFFRLTVDNDFVVSQLTETLTFVVGGTDEFAYSTPADVDFNVSTGSSPKGAITSFGRDDNGDLVTLNPTATQGGILLYVVAATGNERRSADELLAAVENELSNEDAEEDNEVDEQEVGESWADYQSRLYVAHLQKLYTGVLVADSNGDTEVVELDYLWGNTQYFIDGYLVTGSAVSEQLESTEVFSTQSWTSPAKVTINIEGDATSEDSQDQLLSSAALVMGLNPDRVTIGVALDPARRLAGETSTATLVTLQDRSVSSPSPSDYLTTLRKSRDSYNALLTGLVASSISEPDEFDTVVPVWTREPQVTGQTETSLTVDFLSNTAGTIHCIADESASEPSATQVYSGLNAANEEVEHGSVDTDLTESSNSLTITGLESGTTYNVWCVASDDLPLWPTLQAASLGDKGTTDSVEVEEDGSSASYISTLLILLVAFLLN